jgi:adenylate cyclase
MRKSTGICLLLAFLVGSGLAFLEQRRGVYFLEPSSTLHPHHGFDFGLAYLMQRMEWSTSDLRFKIRGSRPTHPDIAIIKIDDASLAELHQWPWPRSIHAQLIRTLQPSPPKALLFDVVFIEPFNRDAAGDRELIKATVQNPWVVHALFFDLEGDHVTKVSLPFKSLLDAVHDVGNVNASVDEDGVLRQAVLQRVVGDQSIPLLSVAGSAVYLEKSAAQVIAQCAQDGQGRMLLNYVGPEYSFNYISYADVLSGKVPASWFKGKIVLVGSTATATFDHYPTPTSSFMPGVEFHANVIDNLLHKNPLRLAGLRWTYFFIGFFAVFCGAFLVRFSAWAGALWTLGLGVLYMVWSQYFFTRHSLVLDAAGPLTTLSLSYVAIVIYRFFTEEREKRWVKAAFGQYVSPKVLDILMDDPSKLKMVGERRDMTVFFSDVAGFTSISERLNPDELVVLLNRYLSAMTEVVFEFDGYLNKYMGDGIMAFWNAPVKQADHADRACRCALRSMQRLAKLNQELEKQGGLVPLNARIGLNSGTMVVGNMGSIQKSDYTVMGDNVNLGSRLEGANKAFGSSIMISEFTYNLVSERFDVRFLDKIRVPGKAKPVITYELLSEKGQLAEHWQKGLPLYHEAIQLFADRQFDLAREKFLEVLKIWGHDKPCETYIERAQFFAGTPPAKDWDGVFELKTK